MPAETVRPVSLAQRVMLGTGPEVCGEWFTMNAVLRLSGSLDPRVVTAAANELVARHDILRTRVPAGSDPVQVVTARATPAVEVVDGRGAASATWTHAPVPRDQPCPLVLRLIRRAPDDDVLAVHLHHLAADPTTVWLVLTELAALYTAIKTGGARPPGPAAQYGEYVAYEAERAQSDHDQAMTWWTKAMSGPFASPRPAGSGPSYAFRAELLSADQLALARRLSTSDRTTLLTTLFAALACTLRPHLTDGTLLCTTAFAKRDRPEWRRVLGPCLLVASVPLPAAPEQLTLDYAQAVRDILVKVQRHARVSHAHIRSMAPADLTVPFFEYVPDDWLPAFAFGTTTAHLQLAAGPKDVSPGRRPLAIRSRETAAGTLTAHLSGDGRTWPEARARTLRHGISAQLLSRAAMPKRPVRATTGVPQIRA